ncbi:MAG: transcriptional regulator PpsR [Pseudomonadota bacterium]
MSDEDAKSTGGSGMTSRGTKYWNSGAIPLIAPEILGDIIAQVADVGVVISETGTVLSILANPNNDGFKNLESWENADLRDVLTTESIPKFDSRLAEFLEGAERVRPVELNHTDGSGRWELPVRYSFHRIGPDGAILLLGRDLRPIAEMQQQLVQAQLALERDYENQREYDTRFRVLMNSTTEPVVFVDLQSGDISDANGAAANLLGRAADTLIGAQLSTCFEPPKRGDISESLATQALSGDNVGVLLELSNGAGPVQVYPTLFRAAGERVLLCRLITRDATHDTNDELTRSLGALYREGPEAMVFVSESGDILSANEAFLDLVDVAHDINVRGRAIAEYLLRGSVDFKVMSENAARAGRMRNYATKIAGAYSSPRSVEISVTSLAADDRTVFALVVRDASRGEATQASSPAAPDESMRSVVELVGSATLKDIVAETTNVVEKMCIETAVELTMNNRVAAAEMLGLSRQSLYVKLRKFDLLARDAHDQE